MNKTKEVDIETRMGNTRAPKALLCCQFGASRIVVWPKPDILNPCDAWQKLTALAAWIVGLDDQGAVTVKSAVAASELGNNHRLVLTSEGFWAYQRLGSFELKLLQSGEF